MINNKIGSKKTFYTILIIFCIISNYLLISPVIFSLNDQNSKCDSYAYYLNLFKLLKMEKIYISSAYAYNYPPHFLFLSLIGQKLGSLFSKDIKGFIYILQTFKFICLILSIIIFYKFFDSTGGYFFSLFYFCYFSFAAGFYACHSDFVNGNIETVQFLLILLYFYFLKEKKCFSAAGALSLLILSKPYLIVLSLLFFVYDKDFRKFIKFCLIIAAIQLIIIIIFSIIFSYKYYIDYFFFLFEFKKFVYKSAMYLNLSPTAILLRKNIISMPHTAIAEILILLFIALSSYLIFKKKTKNTSMKLFIIPFYIILIMPLVWDYYYIFYYYLYFILFYLSFKNRQYTTFFLLIFLFFLLYFQLASTKPILYSIFNFISIIPKNLSSFTLSLIYDAPYFIVHFFTYILSIFILKRL